MDFKLILGENIKDLRKSLKLSQDEFCKNLNIDFSRVNLSRVNLSRVEAGKQMPSAEFIKSVIESYIVSPYWLLDIKKESIDDRLDRIDLLDEEGRIALFNYIDFLLEVNRKTNP